MGLLSPDGVVQSVGNNSLDQCKYFIIGNLVHKKSKKLFLNVVNGKATDANLYGSVFTVKQTAESNRLYKN